MDKVLVIGKGASGCAASSLAVSRGDEASFASGVDLVVASPGVRVMSELEYGCRALTERGWKMLAVTGSKGKSSVVKLVADTINLAGGKAVACGNYGRPVSDVCREETAGWAVVEVSSFMLETTSLPPRFFEAAAVLNLQEDHLDRHGSIEAYHALKMRLPLMAKKSVSPFSPPDENPSLLAGSYFDNAILRDNGLAGAFLMRAASLSDEEIVQGFRHFRPLEHRMSLVSKIDGVKYVDDSKATSIAALKAGVEMAGEAFSRPSVLLIAGGKWKGDDLKIATSTLTKWGKKVYRIGECAEKFFSAWASSVDCEICGTMDKAVEAAARDAEKGDTVLLSPGAASFDQFGNFNERGEYFAKIVKTREMKK